MKFDYLYNILIEDYAKYGKYNKVIERLRNSNLQVQKEIIDEYPKYIQYIENPDIKLQLHLMKNNPNQFKYIKNPDRKIQEIALKYDGYNLEYIKNPDKYLQLFAVNSSPESIKYIENPDKDVQLAAVKKYGESILQIKNPDVDVQLAAVNYIIKADLYGRDGYYKILSKLRKLKVQNTEAIYKLTLFLKRMADEMTAAQALKDVSSIEDIIDEVVNTFKYWANISLDGMNKNDIKSYVYEHQEDFFRYIDKDPNDFTKEELKKIIDGIVKRLI